MSVSGEVSHPNNFGVYAKTLFVDELGVCSGLVKVGQKQSVFAVSVLK